MATNIRTFDTPPEAVWSVLADPYTYNDWVVGAADTRFVEGDWPSVGATFHHTQGIPRIGAKDTTSVLALDEGRYLKLCVRVRPFVIAQVEFTLDPVDGGRRTRVTMKEVPVGGIARFIHNPLQDLLFKLRNTESLRRLERWSVKRAPAVAASASASASASDEAASRARTGGSAGSGASRATPIHS